MSINNFDQSSSGINLDLDIMRDEDLARENFNDALKRIEVAPHSNFDFYAIDLGSRDDLFEFTDPTQYAFTRDDLNRAIRAVNGLPDDLRAELGGSPFASRYTKAHILEALRSLMSGSDFVSFMVNNFKTLFQTVACYGYSQGDYIVVVYGRQDVEEMIRAHGKPWQDIADGAQSELTHLIYAQPVWGSFKVCAGAYECEYMIDQFLADPYEYDRDQILAGYAQAGEENAEIGAAAYAFLEANLPMSL